MLIIQAVLFLLVFPAAKEIEVVTSTDYSKESCKKVKLLLKEYYVPRKV